MKKLLCVLGAVITLALTIALAGCSDNSSDSKFVGEWECVSLTQFNEDYEITNPLSAEETYILVVNSDGTFKATGKYRAEDEMQLIVEGNWIQNGDTITVSKVHFGDVASDDDSRLTIIVTDDEHITLKIEVEVFTGLSNGTSYNFKRK